MVNCSMISALSKTLLNTSTYCKEDFKELQGQKLAAIQQNKKCW